MTTAPPTRIYFDTSAFSALWKASPAVPERVLLCVRLRMVSSQLEKRPVVIISVTLLNELAAAHEQGPEAVNHLREQMQFLAGCGCRMPLSHDACVKAEVQGRQGSWADPAELRRLLGKVIEDRALVAAERNQFAGRKDTWLDGEQSARDRLLAELGDQGAIGKMGIDWCRNLEFNVEDWCRDDMRRNASLWGLPSDEADWPGPRTLRTLWAYVSYKLARIALVHRDGRRLHENDLADHQHYFFAAHADVLVSEDRRFREIAALCPPPKPRVVTLAEWVAEVIGAPADGVPETGGNDRSGGSTTCA